jgi:hypothetical protein
MDYQKAKEILRDAVATPGLGDVMTRLSESPGQLSVIDTSTAGKLPEGDSYGDQILRAMLVVRRQMAGRSMVERELVGIFVFLDIPIRTLAAKREYDGTRIPQISLILDAICIECMASHS